MYESHWGLEETPFRSCLGERFFYASPTHEEALARLHFLVDQHRRLGLLMGESGSGKSLLFDVFLAWINRQGLPVAKLSLLGMSASEFLWELSAGFGLNPDRSTSGGELWGMLVDRLAEYRYQKLGAVVLLDDADRADTEVLTQVTRLVEHEVAPEFQLTIILAGQPERMARLDSQLLELAELRIDVEPWQAGDTESFVSESLSQVGRQSPLFDEPAVTRLHELSHGVPRRVSQLADLALMAGAGRELDHIDAQLVESAYRGLGLIEV